MKILQVCPYDFSRPGGVKNHICGLSDQLERKGHQVKIIAPALNGYTNTDHRVHFFGNNRSVNIWGTVIDICLVSGNRKRALKRFLERERFDIIHYHTIWNPFLPLQIRCYSKAKNIATFHDSPKYRFIGKTIMPLAASILMKKLDGVISVSKTQAAYLSLFSKRNISIIPNGIDLLGNNLSAENRGMAEEGRLQLLFLGRLEPRKGLFYALKAYQKLKPTYPNLTLKIAGDGELKEEAEHFVQRNHLKGVTFLGRVNEKQKQLLFHNSDIYLAPALYGESFGIVLLEALAAGTPIVGFGNEGYLNIIPKEWRSFFPVPEDLKTFTEKLEEMIVNPEIRLKMVHWGSEEVKKYDWQCLADEILNVYLKE